MKNRTMQTLEAKPASGAFYVHIAFTDRKFAKNARIAAESHAKCNGWDPKGSTSHGSMVSLHDGTFTRAFWFETRSK